MWMSTRFFEKIPFDVHNGGMATDRHQAPSYPLRMPEDLKAKVQAAADRGGRSLHAELLLRIEASFAADAEASAGALMREMRRTQLLLRRSDLRSEANQNWSSGREAALYLKQAKERGEHSPEREQAEAQVAKILLKKGHLEAEMAKIDGQLAEIARQSTEEERGEVGGHAISRQSI